MVQTGSSCQLVQKQLPFEPENFHSFRKLIRVFCHVYSFLKLLRTKEKPELVLTAATIQSVTIKILRLIQVIELSNENSLLKQNEVLPSSNSYKTLCPFIDQETDLLRVGGRINQGNFSDLKKNPILIPKNSAIVNMLIADAHYETLHGGVELVLNTIRQTFWIVAAKPHIKRFIKKCVTCSRYNSKEPIQLMGYLPAERISASRPFNDVGIDFTGPFLVKTSQTNHSKVYVCIFVCMSTKACHLETVSSLNEKTCLATITRFCARRGRPVKIFSDNATNFIASRSDLDFSFNSNNFTQVIKQNLSSKGIEWLVIPVRAPHFGGLWETSIKSLKHHLRRTMKKQILMLEDFTTLLTQIECMLNSRPITAMSTDANDLTALTPGHFLIVSPINVMPEITPNPSRSHSLKDFQR